MTRNLKISLSMLAVATVALVAAAAASGTGPATTDGNGTGSTLPEQLVRDDSHRLSTAEDGKVTFVEFLDFECEGCGAAYPAIEQLRETYAGEVTFVVRYFPMPGHKNSELAARAAEAAAAQGQFEAMYDLLFQTQAQWGERSAPDPELFVGMARQLGLDLAAFERDLNDPATIQRVRRDRADGEALGVQGTPTFFLNGEMLQVSSLQQLQARLDAAVNAN